MMPPLALFAVIAVASFQARSVPPTSSSPTTRSHAPAAAPELRLDVAVHRADPPPFSVVAAEVLAQAIRVAVRHGDAVTLVCPEDVERVGTIDCVDGGDWYVGPGTYVVAAHFDAMPDGIPWSAPFVVEPGVKGVTLYDLDDGRDPAKDPCVERYGEATFEFEVRPAE